MEIKDILSDSVKRKNKGMSLEENIKATMTDQKNLNEYLLSCILYNYEKYDLCLEQLNDCYNQYDLFDASLLSYAMYSSVRENQLDIELFLDTIKLIAQTQDLYTQPQIDLIKKSIFSMHSAGLLDDKCYGILEQHLPNMCDKTIFLQGVSQKPRNNISFPDTEAECVVNCFYNESCSGIGDFLRGCCFMHGLMSQKNVKFGIDFSKHDIGKHIKSSKKYKFNVEEIFDTEKTNKDFCSKENYIQNIKNNLTNLLQRSTDKKIFLFTNYSSIIDSKLELDRISLTKQCQNFMAANLIFSKEVDKECKRLLHFHYMNNYEICHFRLGDKYILNKTDDDEPFENLFKKLMNVADAADKKNRKVILLSDSNQFKQYCARKIPDMRKSIVKIIHTKSQHCSNNPGSIKELEINKQEKIDNMFYVALDMKFISEASALTSYSIYPWGSGFSFWTAKIFNVPTKSHLLSHKQGDKIDWQTQ